MAQFGVQIHSKSKTKNSGNGKRKSKNRDKKRSEMGSYFVATRFGAENVQKTVRSRGGKTRPKLMYAGSANLLTKDGYKRVKITGVAESKDNRNFARLNIITKGTVIETELGKAVVTNSPGREGGVNAKLLS